MIVVEFTFADVWLDTDEDSLALKMLGTLTCEANTINEQGIIERVDIPYELAWYEAKVWLYFSDILDRVKLREASIAWLKSIGYIREGN